MSAGLAASTVTPGSTPPDSSRTTPAREACAQADVGSTTTHANRRMDLRTIGPSSRKDASTLPRLGDQRSTILRLNAHPEPFDSTLILSLSKDERFAQDRPVEG